MFLPFIIMMMIGIFVLQLVVCMKGKTALQRMIPLILLLVLEGICWLLYFWAMAYMKETFGSTLTAWVGAVIVLFLIAADGLAWLAWAVVRFAQKRRK